MRIFWFHKKSETNTVLREYLFQMFFMHTKEKFEINASKEIKFLSIIRDIIVMNDKFEQKQTKSKLKSKKRKTKLMQNKWIV